jgi:hypothetical protein
MTRYATERLMRSSAKIGCARVHRTIAAPERDRKPWCLGSHGCVGRFVGVTTEVPT